MTGTFTDDSNSQNQDKDLYGLRWSQFNQSYIPPNGYQSIYDAFEYKDSDQLQGSPITGQFKTYDGSGYKYELRGQLCILSD